MSSVDLDCGEPICSRCGSCHICNAHRDPLVRLCIQMPAPQREEASPSLEIRCHCGAPLHYESKAVEDHVMDMVRLRGRYVKVDVDGDTWLVCRHYLALHELRKDELPNLGFARIPNENA